MRKKAVRRRPFKRIRTAILTGDYDLTRHAMDEMADDGLGILNGEMTK